MASDRKIKQQKFLEAYSSGSSLSASARTAGVDRRTVYFWKEDEDFAKRFADAYEDGNDCIDDEILRRGVTGWDEPLVSAGKLVCTVLRHSDAMTTLLAKSRMSKYREKQQVEMSGPDGGPIQHETVQVYIPDNGRDHVEGVE